MNPQLALWKSFIDELVGIRTCVLCKWVTEKGWPILPQNPDNEVERRFNEENRRINEMLGRLTPEDKGTVALILQQARDGGIHDTLAVMTDRIHLKGMRLSENGVEMAVEPYGSELYWDFTCRSHGDAWPEHQLDDRYR